MRATPYQPLSPAERQRLRASLYGQRGVILATPALFNVLRLGPNPRGTLTANLLQDDLDPRVVDALLQRNRLEFKRFREYGFLAAAGVRGGSAPQPAAAATAVSAGEARAPLPTDRADVPAGPSP